MRKSQAICGLIISFSLLCTIANAQVTFTLSPDHTKVFAGENTNIYLNLRNDGARSISEVVLTVNMPGEIGGTREFTVHSIPAGSTYTKTIQIFTTNETAPGNYYINATVAYGGETIEYPNVTLEVSDFPLSVDIRFLNSQMGSGEQNSLIASIKNIGSDALDNVNIDVDYPGGFITNMSKNLYVPEMVSNLLVQQEFTFTAPATANGNYHVGVKIDFKENGIEHSVQRFAAVYVAGSPSFGWLETILTIMIVILIGLILLGRVK